MTQEALRMALEALTYIYTETTADEDELIDQAITAIKEALAKEKTLQTLHSENERLGLYKEAYAEPEQEPVAHWSDCAVHSEPAYPKGECDCGGFATPPQRTEQEPVAGTKTWLEDGKVITQHLTASDIYKEPDEEEYLSKAYRLANELRCHLATAPAPQRTWVGLTNNELQPIADEYRILFGGWVEDFARAIEAKLKEKNGA